MATYTQPKPHAFHDLSFAYAEPEDRFTVFDCFNCVSRFIDGPISQGEPFRMLATATLELFGWEALPLTQLLRQKNAEHEDIWNARNKDADGLRVHSLPNYWGLRKSLLALPLSWDRPNVIEGDTVCNSMLRRRDWEKHPLLANAPYMRLRKKLATQAFEGMKVMLEIDEVIVSIYGPPQKQDLTVGAILKHNPSIQEHFFCSYDDF